tara:strand:+ start:9127 stop:12924 length:3798 start_codon:yes stop_codon:yes gene_type:complete
MENKSSINSTSANSTSQSTPDEIYIAENHPNAKNFVNVAGRCYQKTSDSSTTYSITTENVFSGLLKRGDVTVHNPHNDFSSATATRTDLVVGDFADCDACENLGDKFRGQHKENFRDFHIKVIKEVDDNLGDVVAYRLSGEDRKGKFTLHGNRHLEIYDKDSITFDTTSLGDEESSFVVSGGLSPDNSSKPNKTIVGKPRYDELLSTSPAHSVATLSVGNHTYTGGSGLGGNIVVKANPFNENPEYNDTKLKQFPDRLHNIENSSFVIKNDGKVLVAGENDEYQLAKGRTNRKFNELHENIKNWQESEINEIGQIKKIVGHSKTIGFLTYDNKFYVAGRNDANAGNLGQGSTSAGNSFTPKQILIDHADKAEIDIKLSSDIHTQIVDADIGRFHGIALDVNQRIWLWGNPGVHGAGFISGNNVYDNASGPNGGPTTRYRNIIGLTNSYHDSYAMYEPGIRGQVTNSRYATSYPHAQLVYWDNSVAEDTNSAYITDNTVFELNIPNNKIYQVACTLHTSFILTLDGAVFSSGFNGHGETGQGHRDFWNDFKISEHPHKAAGKVVNTGGKLPGDTLNNEKIHVKKIITGDSHVLLHTYDNKLYGFGLNNEGQLGVTLELDENDDNFYSTTPVLLAENVFRAFAGSNSSAYITLNGKVFVCGENTDGQLGIDRYADDAPVPGELSSSKVIEVWTECNRMMGAVEIKLGKNHSTALLSNGQIIGFGETGEGQLGNTNFKYQRADKGDTYESTMDVDFPRLSTTLTDFARNINFDLRLNSIQCGADYTMLHLNHGDDTNKIKSCGKNTNNASMQGDGVQSTELIDADLTFISDGAKLKQIESNFDYTHLLTDKGELFAIGHQANYSARLGTGTKNASDSSETAIPVLFNEEPITNINKIATGEFHGLALDTNNRLYLWGNPGVHGAGFISGNNVYDNASGPDGGPTTRYRNIIGLTNHYHDSYAMYEPGIRGQVTNSRYATSYDTTLLNDGQENVIPEYVGKIIDVKCAGFTSYLLNEYGELFSAGFNGHGELGQGHRDFWNDFKISDSIHTSFGRVFSFNGLKDVRVKRVIPGHFHCFAILEDNSLYGWGLNNNYQLGLSEENTIDGIHRDHYTAPILIDTDVDDVFAGEHNSAVKKLDGSIYAMGYNKTGVIAMFGDGRALGLDRHNSTDGVVSATDYAKVPTPWFEASDGIVEVAFGEYHSIIKQIDRTSGVKIKYYSAGNNTQGERGLTGYPHGGTLGEWDTSYDNKTDTYAGSDRWTLIHTEDVS